MSVICAAVPLAAPTAHLALLPRCNLFRQIPLPQKGGSQDAGHHSSRLITIGKIARALAILCCVPSACRQQSCR